MLLFLRREELHRSIDRSIERSRDKDDDDDDDEDDDVVVKGREGRLSRMTAPSGERRRAHLLCFERSVCSISRLVPLLPLASKRDAFRYSIVSAIFRAEYLLVEIIRVCRNWYTNIFAFR